MRTKLEIASPLILLVSAWSRAAAQKQTSISVSAKVPQTPAVVFPVAAGALMAAGLVIRDSSSATGQLSTEPSFTWPAGTESESWHGKDSPGVAVVVTIRPVGADSASLDIAAFASMRSVPEPSGESNLRIITALKVANVLRKGLDSLRAK